MSSSFGELYKIMGDATKVVSPFLMGIVKTGFPNIEIESNGIVLDKYSLKVNSNMKVLNYANVSCDTGKITHNLKDELKSGDTVLLVRVNNQFIVLCKVVSI